MRRWGDVDKWRTASRNAALCCSYRTSTAAERIAINQQIGGEMSQHNNYPADPDKMRLPVGTTCGDCHHIKRCKAIFGLTETYIYCYWSLCRFVVLPIRQ